MMLEFIPWRLRVRIFSIFLKWNGVEFENHVSFKRKFPVIINKGKIKIGGGVQFDYYRMRSYIGVNEGAVLEIGKKCYFNEGVHINVNRHVKIGDFTSIGPRVSIMDCDGHESIPGQPLRIEPVSVGKNVWLGTSCIILPGVSVGDHSIIGAGSVVTGDIPARCIAAGIPARVIRSFEAPDGWIRK